MSAPNQESPGQRWDQRYRDRLKKYPGEGDSHPFLVAHQDILPTSGAALDIACGLGRNTFWLASTARDIVAARLHGGNRKRHADQRTGGLSVTAIDASRVACDRVQTRAKELGLSIRVLCRDLEREPLPDGPFDLIVNTLYLQRSLSPQIESRLAPGGLLVFVTLLEGGSGPPPVHKEYQLRRGELPTLFPNLEVIEFVEDSPDAERPTAGLIARKPLAMRA